MQHKRKKIWIDRFQTRLSLCIGFYFALYQFAIWALVAMEKHMASSLEAIMGPAGAGWVIILTLVVVALGMLFIYDAIRLSHRIVGPIYRFRKTIEAIKAGEEVNLVTLRKGDFLQELGDELNEMIKVLEKRGAVRVKKNAAKENAANVPNKGEVVFS